MDLEYTYSRASIEQGIFSRPEGEGSRHRYVKKSFFRLYLVTGISAYPLPEVRVMISEMTLMTIAVSFPTVPIYPPSFSITAARGEFLMWLDDVQLHGTVSPIIV